MPKLTDDTDFPLDAVLTGAEKVVFTEGTSIKKATLDDVGEHVASRLGVALAEDFGAVGDGVADDTTAVQAALDGATNILLTGSYRCTASLTLPSDTHIILAAGSHLIKDFVAGAGTTSAFIRNPTFSPLTKINRSSITGPGKIGATSHTETGKIITVHGDDLRFADFTIDTFASGQAMVLSGDRMRLDNITVTGAPSTAGTGGIRYVGGNDFVAKGCHVVCGDDSLQFAPVASSTDPLFDLSITNGAYVGCTGRSTAARFMVAILVDPSGTSTMSAAIKDCSFINCHGASSLRGIVVENEDSSGAIDGVSFVDCSTDEALATTTTQVVLVSAPSTGAGGVKNVRFDGLHIRNPRGQAIYCSGPAGAGAENVTFENLNVDAPATAPGTHIALDSVVGLTVRGGVIRGGGTTNVISIGAGTSQAKQVTVDSVRFASVPTNVTALNMNFVTGGRATGLRFVEATTTAKGVRVGSSSSKVTITETNFDTLTVSTGNKLIDLAADTIKANNFIS